MSTRPFYLRITIPKKCNSPVCVFALLAITISAGEVMVMLLLPVLLPPLSYLTEAIADALLLTVITIPALYFFIYKPMAVHIEQRRKVEEEQKCLIRELKVALEKIKVLSGFLPICASCKKIRDKDGTWVSMERYIGERSEAKFTHGMCDECEKRFYAEAGLKKKAE